MITRRWQVYYESNRGNEWLVTKNYNENMSQLEVLFDLVAIKGYDKNIYIYVDTGKPNDEE